MNTITTWVFYLQRNLVGQETDDQKRRLEAIKKGKVSADYRLKFAKF